MSDEKEGIELTGLTAWIGFNSLAAVIRGTVGMDADTFGEARRLFKALKPHAVAREEGKQLIGEQYGEMIQGMMGSQPKTDEDGNMVWREGQEVEGRKALKALNEEVVVIECPPLKMSKLVPEGAKVANPGELINLEELGLVVD